MTPPRPITRPLGATRSIVAGGVASGGVLALALAVRALAGRPLTDGASASYPLSGPTYSQVGVLTVLLVAGCCWLAGRRWMASPPWVAAGTIVWPLLALVAELGRDGTSHNLLPFEVLMWSVVVVPALLATHLGRRSLTGRNGGASAEASVEASVAARPDAPAVRGNVQRTGIRTPVPGLPQVLRDWSPSSTARRGLLVGGAALLLTGLSGSGLAALALPLGAISLMVGVLGRIPVRRRWWHRLVR